MASKIKQATVRANLPELPASHYHQVASGQGSSATVAIGRAIDALFGKPHVKGRRITQLTGVSIFIETLEAEDESGSAE